MKTLMLGSISLLILLSGCAITGPADDGFENSLESVDIGKLQTNDLFNRLIKTTTGPEKTTGDAARTH